MDAYASDLSRDESLARQLGACALVPEAFPDLVYPWGQKGHRLEHKTLRRWQAEFLKDLGEKVRATRFDPSGITGPSTVDPLLFSTASGHGIGKSALVAMLVHWGHFCWPMSRIIVTANTLGQLKSRTWAAVGEWWRFSAPLRSISTYLASQGHMVLRNNQYPESWDAIAATAQSGQEESLQGQHSPTLSALIVDEASLMRPEVMQATRGAMVGGMGMMALFGNPTRNSGPFYASHHAERDQWIRRKIDSREVEDTDGPLLRTWEEAWGEDSDEFRVRVRGEFPRSSDLQFIPGVDIERAFDHEYEPTFRDPLVFGCDVAHTGSDNSVLIKRHGDKVLSNIFASPTWPVEQFEEIIIREAIRDQPDAIFVDGGGVGAGVPGHLRRSLPMPIHAVNGGERSPDPNCANMRTHCWNVMKQALLRGIDLPTPKETHFSHNLRDDLTALEYKYTITGHAIQLERKDEAKKRGIASPDFADALSLTYAFPVAHHRAPDPFVGDRPDGIHSNFPGPAEAKRSTGHLGMRRRGWAGVETNVNPKWRR